MNFSKYQQDIFEMVSETNNNIVVQATAGSGKTTTIIEAARRVNVNKSSLFVAFNKSIVEELKSRLPNNVDCSTLHSMGMRSLYGQYAGKIRVYENKPFTFIDQFVKTLPKKEQDEIRNDFKVKVICKDVMNLSRLNLAGEDIEELGRIADYYAMPVTDQILFIAEGAMRLMQKYNNSSADEKMVDFVDMIWLPAINSNIRLRQYDVVFVDEAQDLNRAQQTLVEKATKLRGRNIYVGDRNQAIYGFAGADAYSFDRLKKKENTVEMPLSISYRCAKGIVMEAQKVYPDDIEPFEGSDQGEVSRSGWNRIQLGDMVVCRNTAPLVSLYFDLLSCGIKAHIKGKDMEKGILRLLSKVEFLDISQGLDKLDDKLDDLYEELEKKGVFDPTTHTRYRNLELQIDIIRMISEEGNKLYMKEVKEEVLEIFRDDAEGVEMMTIHKSKGLEKDRVFFLNPELIPSKWANTKEEMIQESNLRFVAITRAKSSLVYIPNYVMRQDRD